MRDAYKGCKIFEPFPRWKIGDGLKSLAEQDMFPYYSDGVAYYNVCESFVKDWLSAAGSAAYD